MVWTAPTIVDLANRFPEFDSVSDGTLQAVLDEAVGEVGPTWLERDRTPAVLHLAAHLLAVSGHGVASAGGAGAGLSSTPSVKRRKVGDVEVEYNTSSAHPASTETGPLAQYYATPYGVRYVQLMRKNFPAIAVV